jgi:CelD/BcsL family acetyltransferase involved in cellulose biosynthesis
MVGAVQQRGLVSTANVFIRTIRKLFAGELKISAADGPAIHTVERLGVSATCHRQWPTHSAFAEGWDRLSGMSGQATTFNSRTWQWEGVGPTLRPGALRLITASKGEELLAVLPMEITPTGFLESTGHAVSDYLDPLVHPQFEREVWAAVIALIDELWDRELKAVTLHNVGQHAPCREMLPIAAGEHGLTCDQTVVSNAARIKLPGTWEQYLESLEGHERKELRRKIRKAQEQAGARLVVMDGESWDEGRLARALDLIEAADATKGEWLAMHVRPLLARVGATLAREGRMRLLMLMLGETAGAALFEFPSARGPLLYNSGYDPAQRQWSPGAVMFGLAVKEAIEGGATVFDLLRGREEYKYRMGAVDDGLYRISMHRP